MHGADHGKTSTPQPCLQGHDRRAQPEAAEAGHITLKAGGNALDAVIACALTQAWSTP